MVSMFYDRTSQHYKFANYRFVEPDEFESLDYSTKMKTVKDLVLTYYSSNDFSMLRESLRKTINTFSTCWSDEFGNELYNEVTSKQAKHAYEEWCSVALRLPITCVLCHHLLHYAMEMEYATVNPFANIKRHLNNARLYGQRMIYSQFLHSAYSDFDYRNIGLIVHMAYEWCQRLGDMRLLTWDVVDLDKQKLYLEQSKRRAEVFCLSVMT